MTQIETSHPMIALELQTLNQSPNHLNNLAALFQSSLGKRNIYSIVIHTTETL